jgi:hypothetical protein
VSPPPSARPTSRLVPNLVIAAFLAFQLSSFVNAVARTDVRFPWAMFRGMWGVQQWLEAAAVTPDGEELPIPLDVAFPYHASQQDLAPLDDDTMTTERLRKLAPWLGRWMRERGTPVARIRYRWRVLNVLTKAVTHKPILEVALDAPAP